MKKTREILFVAALCCSIAPAARAQRPVCLVNGVRVDNGGPGAARPFGRNAAVEAAIEKIEVLKGAMAVKMYGPEAVNGVISITTKKDAAASKNWSAVCGSPATSEADPFASLLYTPEFVMAHQEAIGLTDLQRFEISAAVRDVQGRSTDTQFKLAAAVEKLTKTLSPTKVEATTVLLQVDEVLSLERLMKQQQLILLVRVKNQLTAEQQAALDKLR